MRKHLKVFCIQCSHGATQRVGDRLQHGILHHAHAEASLIPADKETSLGNEVQ